MDVKTELVAGPVAGQNAGGGANSWMGYWEVVRSRLGILRGCLAGLSAVALVTFFALRLNLNLSASGSLCFLIVVMVSVIWGFWEASVTSLIAVNCLNYFFVPPVFTWTVSDPQNWVALVAFEITALTVSRLSTRAQDQARAEPPHSAAGSPPNDWAADGVSDSRSLRGGIGGPVRRQVGSGGCDRFRGN